jgi:hypothetical protein
MKHDELLDKFVDLCEGSGSKPDDIATALVVMLIGLRKFHLGITREEAIDNIIDTLNYAKREMMLQ